MDTSKQVIVGWRREDNKQLFLRVNEDGTADWVESKTDATIYPDVNSARRDWFGLNKTGFRHVFVVVADSI